MDNINPGSNVNVTIVKEPRSLAARKTLVRLLSKDAGIKKVNELQRSIRKKGFNPQPRGGRLYAGRIVKQHPVKGVKGEQGTIFASVDVINDLKSVARFVEVKKA